MKTLVYIAGPYTKGDVAINVHRMIKCCSELAEKGYGVYCPLLTHFWHLIDPHPYEFWLEVDNAILPRCDCLLRIPGESSGADKEIEQMKKLGKLVYLSMANLFDKESVER